MHQTNKFKPAFSKEECIYLLRKYEKEGLTPATAQEQLKVVLSFGNSNKKSVEKILSEIVG